MSSPPVRPRRVISRVLACAAVLVASLAAAPSPALASAPIVLDGLFDDWDGKLFIPDPRQDIPQLNFHCDIHYWFLATNDGEEALYFMVERYAKKNGRGFDQPVAYWVYMDMDCDGVYTETIDYVVACRYDPAEPGDNAEVAIYRGDAPGVPVVTYSGHWGESYNPGMGLKVEWRVAFADVGLGVGQPMKMYLASSQWDSGASDPHEDFCPDTGSVDWAPVGTLGTAGVAVLIIAALAMALASMRRKPVMDR